MSYTLLDFDIHGHRGCRGLMPENSIPGFIKAVQLGVTTLEMDVVITGDNQVLVSHDPFMSHEICCTRDGKSISIKDEKKHNIFQMDLLTIQQYDCGSSGHLQFPNQVKMSVHKPLLSDVIDAVEKFVSERKMKPINYNIETKCTPEGDGIFHPSPEIFTDLVMNVIHSSKIQNRTIIQSFDVRTLQYLKNRKENIRLSLLVENLKSCKANIDFLGFTPEIYSPHFKLITNEEVDALHNMDVKIIPWTVNAEKDFLNLIGMGIDGIITDFPDKLKSVVSN